MVPVWRLSTICSAPVAAKRGRTGGGTQDHAFVENETFEMPGRRRNDFALRDRRRTLESRDYNLMLSTIGILACSAFGNLMASVEQLLGGALPEGLLSGTLGAFYVLAIYLFWFRNQRHWWVVALPSGLSVLLLAVCWIAGLGVAIVPLTLNLMLLAMIPLRAQVGSSPPAQWKRHLLRVLPVECSNGEIVVSVIVVSQAIRHGSA